MRLALRARDHVRETSEQGLLLLGGIAFLQNDQNEEALRFVRRSYPDAHTVRGVLAYVGALAAARLRRPREARLWASRVGQHDALLREDLAMNPEMRAVLGKQNGDGVWTMPGSRGATILDGYC